MLHVSAIVRTLTAILAILGAHPGIAAAPDNPAPVVLFDKGSTVIISNGVIAATFSKSKASITSMQYRGFEMLKAGYYSMDGGSNYCSPNGCFYFVRTNTPDLVDIGMKRIWKREPQAFDIEIHYMLRRGDSGFYTYALLEHPAAYPATSVSEWRMVWKLSDDLLEHIYVDELRNWEMPSSHDKAESTSIKEIRKMLSGPRAGRYDCKYDFNANYWDLGCWGHASDRNKVGAWIVVGTHDFFNDGPTKQDLTAAADINHIHFGMNHYNGSTIRVEAGTHWRKLFGPFLLYCNYDARGSRACWEDAKNRAKVEGEGLPDGCLTLPDYPPASQRGTLTGSFQVLDPLKPHISGSNAWVGLAQTSPGGNWQFESKGYQYWTRADAQGKFAISRIRPGTYTLYAFVDGEVGEYSRQAVRIDAATTNSMGNVVWSVPHRGKRIVWEIGVPDRTAREFRHGNDYFQGFLWTQFSKEFPNPLDYYVGKSNWTNDWNYAQTRYTQGSQSTPHVWRVHFTLSEVPQGDAVLTLAIASADRARIKIGVNDGDPVAEVVPSVQGGNALLREGIHAKYCVEYVSIPANRLKVGENIISLSLSSASSPQIHVMYDYLCLEVP